MTSAAIPSLREANDPSEYGGKAAQLARMLGAGLAAPAGLVIGVRTFREHLVRAGLDSVADCMSAALADGDGPRARAAAARLRHALLDCALEPALMKVLSDNVVPGNRYAVRSSAPGEDGANLSFAGQFDSVLGCSSAEAVAAAVRRVWASLYGDRAVAYALHHRRKLPGMAVIVQSQVDASWSGVMFTRDPRPLYGDDLLVEFCAGLGDALVSGRVEPGRLRIERAGATVTLEKEYDGCTTAAAPFAFTLGLLQVAQRLETLLGGALDVEWSVDASGRLFILQARPITAPVVSAPATIWSNANIAENFPEPVCPMLRSFVGRGYGAYFRALGNSFGVSKRRMDAASGVLDRLVDTHAGRLYYNLSNIHAVLHLAPGGPWLARFFNQFTGAEDFPLSRQPVRSAWRRWFEITRVTLHVTWRYLHVNGTLRAFEREIDAFVEQSAPARLEDKRAQELASLMRRFLEIRLERWLGGALADTAAMACYGVLGLLVAGRAGVNVNDLLKGLPGLASAEPVERLWSLSRRVRSDAGLCDAILRETPETVLSLLRSGDLAEFGAMLDDYLDRWGFRYSGELMLSRPTPREDPLPILRMLKRYVEMVSEGPSQISRKQAHARVAVTRAVRRQLNLPRAIVFAAILKLAQGAIRLRERARMKQALLYTRLRHVALALGDRLVRDGSLERREDIFYLHIEEAIAAGEGNTAPAAKLRGFVSVRRAEMNRWRGCQPPDRLVLPEGATWQPADDARTAVRAATPEVLLGTGACGGRFRGTAAVVLDVADIGAIRDDQILVTRQTDPGWATAFFMVKGLVVERGGMLSHGAIIAREYGIPAVVGVRDATRLIETGQTLLVCGDEGRVEHVRG